MGSLCDAGASDGLWEEVLCGWLMRPGGLNTHVLRSGYPEDRLYFEECRCGGVPPPFGIFARAEPSVTNSVAASGLCAG